MSRQRISERVTGLTLKDLVFNQIPTNISLDEIEKSVPCEVLEALIEFRSERLLLTSVLINLINQNNIGDMSRLLNIYGTDFISDKYRSTYPIAEAALLNDTDDAVAKVNFLMNRGADPNVSLMLGQTLVTELLDTDETQILDALLKRRSGSGMIPVDLNTRDRHGRLPINIAVTRRNLQIVTKMLNRGANPNFGNSKSDAVSAYDFPLLRAIEESDPKMVKILLHFGANPNTPGSEYRPLNEAIILSQENTEKGTEIVRLLMSKGSDPNLHDFEQYTAFKTASEFNERIQELLK